MLKNKKKVVYLQRCKKKSICEGTFVPSFYK